MVPHLSTRAFKFLRSISRKSGIKCSDEEIHDIGTRLLTLCEIAAETGKEHSAESQQGLTAPEAYALKTVGEQFASNGQCPSARKLSTLLGYRSSRSGHRLLQRLVARGLLVRNSVGRLSICVRTRE